MNEYIGGICGVHFKYNTNSIEQNYWLQEGIPGIGRESDSRDTNDENIVQNCFRLTQAQMKGQEPYDGVLYKSAGGKSVNIFLEALNTFLEDNKNDLPKVHFWEYSSIEPYPVLSKSSIK